MNLKEWIFTTDHKRVGILYLIGSIAAFAVAGIMALLMRAELSTIGPTITANPANYNVWLYAHGAVMILGFQIPALTGFFANFCIPLMIGAKDVAFPRVNALSVWLFYVGIILVLAYLLVLPPLLAKTVLRSYFIKMGFLRFIVLVTLLQFMASLPIKMVLRWTLNLKYIVFIPEFFFNI